MTCRNATCALSDPPPSLLLPLLLQWSGHLAAESSNAFCRCLIIESNWQYGGRGLWGATDRWGVMRWWWAMEYKTLDGRQERVAASTSLVVNEYIFYDQGTSKG